MDSYYSRVVAEYNGPNSNAAWLLCDRHDAGMTAYTLVGVGEDSVVTYGQMRLDSLRLANALRELGVGPGSRVATLLHKGPELITTMLAVWRLGAVYVPLFTAFAAPAVAFRLAAAGVKVVVTDAVQREKLTSADGASTGPWTIVVVDGPAEYGALSYSELLESSTDDGFRPHTQGSDGAFVHIFTSGTTGPPKGVIHPLRHAAVWQSYLAYGLGVTRDDVYWCAADPGWAYGLYAGIVAPLAAGSGTILQVGGFDPLSAWSLITERGVTNFTAAPTVFRALRNAFSTVKQPTRLRRLSSAGEPLTPEVNEWAERELGLLVHDHFGQMEVGMVLANHHHPDFERPIVEGSMGQPLPGWATTVLAEDSDVEVPVGVVGRLAIDTHHSPAMTFRSYQDAGKTASRFAGDGRYYLLGDLGSVDESGAFRFSARDDDVIIMAGYRIGPFEVESVLNQHPAVAESAAISTPDAARGEVLEAYVALRSGFDPTEELAREIQAFVKKNYAAHAYPRAVHFLPDLPKTPSGKTQRYLLRQQRRDEIENQGNS